MNFANAKVNRQFTRQRDRNSDDNSQTPPTSTSFAGIAFDKTINARTYAPFPQQIKLLTPFVPAKYVPILSGTAVVPKFHPRPIETSESHSKLAQSPLHANGTNIAGMGDDHSWTPAEESRWPTQENNQLDQVQFGQLSGEVLALMVEDEKSADRNSSAVYSNAATSKFCEPTVLDGLYKLFFTAKKRICQLANIDGAKFRKNLLSYEKNLWDSANEIVAIAGSAYRAKGKKIGASDIATVYHSVYNTLATKQINRLADINKLDENYRLPLFPVEKIETVSLIPSDDFSTIAADIQKIMGHILSRKLAQLMRNENFSAFFHKYLDIPHSHIVGVGFSSIVCEAIHMGQTLCIRPMREQKEEKRIFELFSMAKLYSDESKENSDLKKKTKAVCEIGKYIAQAGGGDSPTHAVEIRKENGVEYIFMTKEGNDPIISLLKKKEEISEETVISSVWAQFLSMVVGQMDGHFGNFIVKKIRQRVGECDTLVIKAIDFGLTFPTFLFGNNSNETVQIMCETYRKNSPSAYAKKYGEIKQLARGEEENMFNSKFSNALKILKDKNHAAFFAKKLDVFREYSIQDLTKFFRNIENKELKSLAETCTAEKMQELAAIITGRLQNLMLTDMQRYQRFFFIGMHPLTAEIKKKFLEILSAKWQKKIKTLLEKNRFTQLEIETTAARMEILRRDVEKADIIEGTFLEALKSNDGRFSSANCLMRRILTPTHPQQ
ncbi:MAG: hypothetical protein LBI69_04125 [Puniceicoccales bacterium]|jgi:hypothetical protein|nr:hypothetical protein [Puniceicoccales bacterium]